MMLGHRFGLTLGLAAALTLAGGAVARAAGPLSWSSPVLVDNHSPYASSDGGLPAGAVSCPSIRLCVLVDDLGNVITSTNPAGPGSSWRLARSRTGSLTDHRVSCPSVSFCVAVGRGGDVLVSRHPSGHAWSVAHLNANLVGVSCPSRSFCAAVSSAGDVFTSTRPGGGKRTWRVAHVDQVPSNGVCNPAICPTGFLGISCPSRSFCAAIDLSGDVVTSTQPGGGRYAWRVASIAQPDLTAVSCPARFFCVVVDAEGNVLTSTRPNGGTDAWRSARIDTPSSERCKKLTGCAGNFTALTCSSTKLCFAADLWGAIFFSRRPAGGAAAWHGVRPKKSFNLAAISCPSAGLCVATRPGYAITSARPTAGASAWHARLVNAPGVNTPTAITCPSVSLCVAGDTTGNLITSSRPEGGSRAWGFGHVVDGPISAVSCPSTSFCVASSARGVLTSHRPAGGASAWKLSSGPQLSGISCPSTSLCVAFGGNQILTSSDPAGGASTWTVQYTGPGSPCYHCGLVGLIRGLSCPSTTLCIAVDADNHVLSSTDPAGAAGAWTSTQVGSPGSGVSCPTVSFCVISAGQSVLTSTNPASGQWTSAPVENGAPALFTQSCPTDQLCVGSQPSRDLYSASLSLPQNLVLSNNPAGGNWINAYRDHLPSMSLQLLEALYPPPDYFGGMSLSVNGVTGVSCPSATLCVAIDILGRVIVGKSAS
jgi:hypothetical protein